MRLQGRAENLLKYRSFPNLLQMDTNPRLVRFSQRVDEGAQEAQLLSCRVFPGLEVAFDKQLTCTTLHSAELSTDF